MLDLFQCLLVYNQSEQKSFMLIYHYPQEVGKYFTHTQRFFFSLHTETQELHSINSTSSAKDQN